MSKLKVMAFSISIDGYGAGPDQSLENPLGVGGMGLHEWAFATRTFRRMFGQDGGSTGIEDKLAARGFDNIGAWIMGRNMFTPSRGYWPDDGWRGWWGDSPPYHCPVFVLTTHPRPPIAMDGGTSKEKHAVFGTKFGLELDRRDLTAGQRESFYSVGGAI